jgi:hypothetical protein
MIDSTVFLTSLIIMLLKAKIKKKKEGAFAPSL